jgi:hypothetical protein
MIACEIENSKEFNRVRGPSPDFRYHLAAAFIASLVTTFGAQWNLASAATLNYIESVDGELPFFATSPFTLPLDLGANTVSGQFVAGGLEPDFDSFAFLIPAGSQLISFHVVLADVSGDLITADWRVEAGSPDSFAGTFVGFLLADSPGIGTLPNVPLSPAVYSVTHTSNLVVDPSATATYTFTFVLVPEPATSTLLLLGAISALCSRRPKRAPASASRPDHRPNYSGLARGWPAADHIPNAFR